ncbi:hypothetical protein COJ27_09510 [Bacillus cereus]|uniref:hypothetical protein n=1 Tax=Bacillus cereus TaxID=1396 RepID=UPI000BFA7BD5|nr:hypothetical protein [Bacillus cereus]PFL65067.1 hypothetical protein COJ27_09510 [Bacillus cereus]
MKIRYALVTSVALLSILGIGITDSQASTDFNMGEQKKLTQTLNIRDYTITLPTFFSGYQLTYHEPGTTYRTSNDLIKVSSTGQLTTYFSTTAKVNVYRNGVLDHTITVIVGQG